MAATDHLENINDYIAKCALVLWHLGYTPGNYHRTENGGWTTFPPAMPLKHHELAHMAASIHRYGAQVYRAEESVERLRCLELGTDEFRIEPDFICAQFGLTMSLERSCADEDWPDRATAARQLYIQWADEFWHNSSVRTMLERLRAQFAQRDVVLGEDIAHMLEDMRATLGPGGVDAPE
jgi:hypothetical protein